MTSSAIEADLKMKRIMHRMEVSFGWAIGVLMTVIVMFNAWLIWLIWLIWG